MTTYATVKQQGSKFYHEVFVDGELVDTRTSKRRYEFAILVSCGDHDDFIGGWASKPRAAGSTMEKYWTVKQSIPVRAV